MTPEYSIEILLCGPDTWIVALVICGIEAKAACKDRKTAIAVAKAFVDIVFTDDKDTVTEKMKKWDGVFPGTAKDEKKGRDN